MKRRVFLIIDGYNLMHAAGMARQNYGPGDLERCRNRFLNQLVSLLSENTKNSCVVVFDAFDAPADLPQQQKSLGPVLIQFAAPGCDADSEIESMLLSHSAPRQVLIVTSDHRLQKAARRRRARCVDSEVFWNNLNDSASATETHHRRHQHSQKLPDELIFDRPSIDRELLEYVGMFPDDEALKAELETEWKSPAAPSEPQPAGDLTAGKGTKGKGTADKSLTEKRTGGKRAASKVPVDRFPTDISSDIYPPEFLQIDVKQLEQELRREES